MTAENSSHSKAARAPASRRRSRSWPSGCKSLGLGVVVSREPGGSAGAEAIRHVLLSGAAKPLGPHAEAILFAAARADHLRQTIRPALERGQWVISDRFADSTRIYQGVLGNVDARLIARLEKVTVGELEPDLTIILDIPPEIGLARASERRGNARGRPLRGARRSTSTRSCARPIWSSPSASRSAASSSMRAPMPRPSPSSSGRR